MAALAFVLNTALHANHLMPASGNHFHAVSHGATDAPDHRLVDVAGSEAAAHDDGSRPLPGPDTDATCCACTCSPAIVLPGLHAHAISFVVIRTMASASHHSGDGFVPEGPRRPPKPLGIV